MLKTTESSTAVAAFFSKYHAVKYQKGNLLLLPGDTVDSIMYLESGSVNQYALTDTGGKSVLNSYKTGSFFPMSSAVHGTVSKHYFEAVSDGVVIRRAPADAVITFIREHPVVMWDLLSRVYIGLNGLLDRLEQHMGGTARSRLRVELMIMVKRFGELQEDGWYKIKTTDQVLADQTGMSRETVTRVLAEHKKNNIVKRTRAGLLVHPDLIS